jgi:hypothetical protein
MVVAEFLENRGYYEKAQSYRDWRARNPSAYLWGFVMVFFIVILALSIFNPPDDKAESMYSKKALAVNFPNIRVRGGQSDQGLNDVETMANRPVPIQSDYVLANWLSDRSVDINPLNDSMSGGSSLMEMETRPIKPTNGEFDYVPISASLRKSDWSINQ